MNNIRNIDNPTNYYYGSYINYKAIKDYHILKKINDNYIKSNHCKILAFIVERYHKHSKMPNIQIHSKKYVLMNSNYILNNLIYLRIKKRQLKNLIAELKESGIIEIKVIDKSNRYIHVRKEFIELYYNHYDWYMTSIGFLKQYKPEWWRGFVSEWEPYFLTKKDFKRFIDDFNDTRVIEDYSYNTREIYDHLINAVKYKVYGKGKKQGLKPLYS